MGRICPNGVEGGDLRRNCLLHNDNKLLWQNIKNWKTKGCFQSSVDLLFLFFLHDWENCCWNRRNAFGDFLSFQLNSPEAGKHPLKWYPERWMVWRSQHGTPSIHYIYRFLGKRRLTWCIASHLYLWLWFRILWWIVTTQNLFATCEKDWIKTWSVRTTCSKTGFTQLAPSLCI